MSDKIRSWSASRLDTYENCPYRAHLQYGVKRPRPERGDPPAKFKGEWPDERGTRIHNHLEQYLLGKATIPSEGAKHFKDEIQEYRTFVEEEKGNPEQNWWFNKAWEPIEELNWQDLWLIVKTDFHWFLEEGQVGNITDFKSGKKFGKEIAHTFQAQIYALSMFARYPLVEKVNTIIMYIDIGELLKVNYFRHQGERFMQRLIPRANKMINAEKYPPRPSEHTCRFCPYGPRNGDGFCPVGK